MLWRYEILARRSISIQFSTKNRDFDSVRFFRLQYCPSTQLGTSHHYGKYTMDWINIDSLSTITEMNVPWCLSSSLFILVYLFIVLNAVGLQLPPACVRTTITMKIVTSFNPVTSINCCKKNRNSNLAKTTISILVDFDKKSQFSISILRSSQHYSSVKLWLWLLQLVVGCCSCWQKVRSSKACYRITWTS